MKENPYSKLVTVGIPFYSNTDIPNFLTAVTSIINQSVKPKVIHLIQDGPVGKEMANCIKQMRVSEPYITLIKLNKVGTAGALNSSIKRCSTKYYARMDAEDISFNNRLEKQIKYLEENSEIDIIGSWAIEFEDERDKEKGFLKKLPVEYHELKEFFHYRNPLIHPTIVFRKSVFKHIGYYNEKYLSDQDLELWGRVFRNKVNITNLPEPLLYFRTNNMIRRRSSIPAIVRQVKARYSYNTWSVKLNILKIFMLLSRLTPYIIQKFLYKYLRK